MQIDKKTLWLSLLLGIVVPAALKETKKIVDESPNKIDDAIHGVATAVSGVLKGLFGGNIINK